MYNLFIAGNEEMWDKGFAEMEKSRFLEYTNIEIVEQFKNTTEKQLLKLKSLPCLFAYEHGNKKDANIGYLLEITDKGKYFLIEFEFDKNYPPIPYDLIKEMSPLLEIRDWELSRTHWAIKAEDLIKRIEKELNLVSKSTPQFSKIKFFRPEKSNTPTITTVKSYIKMVLGLTLEDAFETFYRGHADKNFKLVPSLYRVDKSGNYKFLDSENVMFKEMLLANPSEFMSDSYAFEKLVRMQHYSLPTRLLDITSNPLIALYFACANSGPASGEVIIFKVKKDKVKYYDSDTASCISNMVKLTNEEKKKIKFDLSVADFNRQDVIQKLHHFIREEKSYFKSEIDPDDVKKIICIKSRKSNTRIASQSGAFLLFGIDSIFDEHGTDDIKIERIEINNKKKILEELDTLNINESTVFPYIESSAKYISSKYEFKVKI